MRRLCGKLPLARTSRTTANCATAARNAPTCTSSVLMRRAAVLSAASIARASGP